MNKLFPLLLLLLVLAGCGGDHEAGGNAAAGAAPEGGGEASAPASAGGKSRGPERLTGLYEGESGAQKNQLCIIEDGGKKPQFGILVWGANLNSCLGVGDVERAGERLTLRMSGDESCAIDAAMRGGTITLSGSHAAGCREYYCGAGATFEGAVFTRRGSTARDALKAKDIAGDPLCG